jgi:hypothetical protein
MISLAPSRFWKPSPPRSRKKHLSAVLDEVIGCNATNTSQIGTPDIQSAEHLRLDDALYGVEPAIIQEIPD